MLSKNGIIMVHVQSNVIRSKAYCDMSIYGLWITVARAIEGAMQPVTTTVNLTIYSVHFLDKQVRINTVGIYEL